MRNSSQILYAFGNYLHSFVAVFYAMLIMQMELVATDSLANKQIKGEQKMATCTVINGTLNVRASKSISSTKLGTLASGTEVNVVCCDNTWATLQYNGTPAFVMHQYLSGAPDKKGEGLLANDTAKTNVSGLNVRIGPGLSYSTTGPQLSKGVSVTVNTRYYNSSEGYYWYRINETSPARWVRGDFLAPSESGGGGSTGIFYAQVTASTLNVRSSPSLGGDLEGVLPNGRILICEESGTSGWYKIRYDGNDAYVSSQYLNQISSPAVHSTYISRIAYQYPPEVGQTNASYYDNASGSWCQLFVNWLLRNAHIPASRVPTTSGTGWGITFWVNNATFYFKSAEHKARINNETEYGYNLNVGDTLTTAEQNYVPSVGDIIYLRWSGVAPTVNVSHTGYVRYVGNGYVYLVEGNADSDASVHSNRSFALTDSRIVGYGKPNYSM